MPVDLQYSTYRYELKFINKDYKTAVYIVFWKGRRKQLVFSVDLQQ